MNEEWRDVPGTNGLYQISISTKEGKCRSWWNNRHGKGKISKILSNTPIDGRIFWNIHINQKQIHMQAAYWIAITYPELVNNGYFDGAHIDHIDTDKLNNQPFN